MSAMSADLASPDVSLEQVQDELRALCDELANAPAPRNSALLVLAPMLAYISGDLVRAESLMSSSLRSADGWVRAAIRATRAFFAENEGQLADMRADIDSAYQDFAAIGDRWGLSSVLTARGGVRTLDGDHDGAIEDYERALRYANELGSSDDDSLIQLRLAGLRLRVGDLAGARSTAEGVRDAIANRSQGIERGMFVDGVLMMIVLYEGDLATATAMAEDARRRVALTPTSFIHGHMSASVGGLTAQVAIQSGDLDTALADLLSAYPVAVSTHDMPIVAGVGVSVACLAAALDRPADAAVILGAAARLRGSDDRADPPVADLTAELHRRLGVEFDEAYASGKSLGRAEAIARLDPALLGEVPPAG
jgi:ATP/maltotriose-dependent transcriptional regulator MalT